MIPQQLLNITELEETQYANQTYKLDLVSKRIAGMVDDKEAVIQSISKILSTERYAYVIYDGEYGVELETLIGKNFDYVISDLGRRLTEAVMVDDRVLEVVDIEFTTESDAITVSATVNTIYGEIPITTEVII